MLTNTEKSVIAGIIILVGLGGTALFWRPSEINLNNKPISSTPIIDAGSGKKTMTHKENFVHFYNCVDDTAPYCRWEETTAYKAYQDKCNSKADGWDWNWIGECCRTINSQSICMNVHR